jgi:hypothetical protein
MLHATQCTSTHIQSTFFSILGVVITFEKVRQACIGFCFVTYNSWIRKKRWTYWILHHAHQSWALPIQVSIFRYSILIGYRKNYRTIGLKKYRNFVYRITNFHFRYSDTVSNRGKSIGLKKYRWKCENCFIAPLSCNF